MLVKYERTSAYICPFCSGLSKKNINAFDFSGNRDKVLHCSAIGCREECATIIRQKNKYKINVECPICGDTHTYSADFMKFWNNRILVYKCPVSGVNILFNGEKNAVDKAIAENSQFYSEIIPDFDDDSNGNSIIFEMLDIVRELNSEAKISCVCGSEQIAIQIMNDSIVLVCEKCKRIRVIENNEHNLTMLLNAEAIVIGS